MFSISLIKQWGSWSSLISKNFTDVKVSHRLKKTDFGISFGFRLSTDFDLDLSYDNKHRYYIDFTSKYDYKRFKTSFRERVQYQGNIMSGYSTIFRTKIEGENEGMDISLSNDYFDT